MTPADIAPVIALEEAAYGSQRPHKDYHTELQKNQLAHYFTLWLAHQPNLVGHAGFWLLVDEIHISTIAIHPAWQRKGLAAWLLLTLMEEGQRLGGNLATLEVRISNQAALALYHRFNFQEVGQRPRYYPDGEDALILTTPSLALSDYKAFLESLKKSLIYRLDKITTLD